MSRRGTYAKRFFGTLLLLFARGVLLWIVIPIAFVAWLVTALFTGVSLDPV